MITNQWKNCATCTVLVSMTKIENKVEWTQSGSRVAGHVVLSTALKETRSADFKCNNAFI